MYFWKPSIFERTSFLLTTTGGLDHNTFRKAIINLYIPGKDAPVSPAEP